MMKVNDFLKYTITLNIEYENYFSLIYDTKYLLEARLAPNRQFVAKKSIYANCRKRAVQKAVQWFWKEFKGALGSVHKTMIVDDSYGEVVYNEDFACNDLGNKYLSEETIARIIEESDGELFRDVSEGSEHHPPNSVKRAKRRRKQSNVIAPCMTQSPAGTIYYRMTSVPQYSKNGKIIQRRKVKNVKLASKTLEKALREVTRRGLDRHEQDDSIPSEVVEENLKKAA
ncbi:MAG: hypothetical protein OSB39_12065 [Opitutales bacterium]|nr:hypothetical protein [Opitutales bacterium]